MDRLIGTFEQAGVYAVGTLIILALIWLTKPSAKSFGFKKLLEYGLGFKAFSILLTPCAAFVTYAAAHASSDQKLLAAAVASCFVAAAIFFTYQVFFVRFSYDQEFVYFESPIAGKAKASWENLVDIGYSSILQADYIVIEPIGRIWCSNMVNGYQELGEFLEQKLEELFPELSEGESEP